MKLLVLALMAAIFVVNPNGNAQNDEVHDWPIDNVTKLVINSSINPATYSYLKSGFATAEAQESDLIVISMATPGGLVTTTKDILTLIGGSRIPIAIWVTPEGASATSAGAIISAGAHMLFMSSGTNIGAAAPVQMGGDIDKKKSPLQEQLEKKTGKQPEKAPPTSPQSSDMKKKAVNDLVALVESLSEARGHNSKLFGEMVSKASSFKAREALEKNLIDGIADSPGDLWKHMNGKIIKVQGRQLKLAIDTPPSMTNIEMDLGQWILNIFANPSLAYLLFLIGAALIYFELQAPGGFIAGSLGAFFIILAGIGFQVLPLNFGALGLIVLSFIFFVIEVYVTSYGILSLAGLASLIFGSLFLFRSEAGHVEIPMAMIVSAVGGICTFIAIVVFVILKDLKKNRKKDVYSLIGMKALISSILPLPTGTEGEGTGLYSIKVHGEVWRAQGPPSLSVGEEVTVTEENSEKMILKITK